MTRITAAPFGTAPSGEPVDAFDFVSPGGLRMRVVTWGATITSLSLPDREGRLADVVLGHDTLEGYVEASPYFGCVVGRCANRIARGRFTLDGVEYQLATNNGPNHLHGGVRGFDSRVWSAEVVRREGGDVLALTLYSPDGEEGYPGHVEVRVTYALSDTSLRVEYESRSSAPTPVNLTQHTYWNLAGHAGGEILGHELQVHAERFTPVDATLIPTGELRPVAGTPFDFRAPTPLGSRIGADDEQLRFAGGYDHNYVLSGAALGEPRPAARLTDPASGRRLEVWTTEPGMQFYSGNFLDGSIVGKGGARYGFRGGLCLETQGFPDAVNRPEFPSVILRPGEIRRSVTELRFGVSPG